MVQMRALVDLHHDGHAVAAGETFQAAPIQAAALKYQRRADYPPTPKPADAVPRKARGYRRRDLRAEA